METNNLYKKRVMSIAHWLRSVHPDYCFAGHLSTAWRIIKLRRMMENGVVHFKFVKKGGLLREAYGTLCMDLIPADHWPKNNDEAASRAFSPLTTAFYDFKAEGWRSFANDAKIDILRVAVWQVTK